MKNKLFAVYLGGRADGCNIELHDVVFAVGPTIESTSVSLAKKWFGNKKKVHMDSYIEMDFVDGHRVELVDASHATEGSACSDNSLKLFFVNFGGYLPNTFAEYHQNSFYVTKTPSEAIARARKDLCLEMTQIHKDDVFTPSLISELSDVTTQGAADDVIEVRHVENYLVSLHPEPGCDNSLPVSRYTPLRISQNA